MKGQDITPWSIYNSSKHEQYKLSTERSSLDKKSLFPSIKHSTQGAHIFRVSIQHNTPSLPHQLPSKLQHQAKPLEQSAPIQPIIITESQLVDQQHNAIDEQLERITILNMIHQLLKKESSLKKTKSIRRECHQGRQQPTLVISQSVLERVSIDLKEEQGSLNRLPEVRSGRIHEGANALKSDKLRMLLNPESKTQTMAKRMQFIWRNRAKSQLSN